MRMSRLCGFLLSFILLFCLIYYYYSYSLKNYDHTLRTTKVQYFPYLPIKLGEQVINIKASFVPLFLHSLSKDVESIPKDQLGSLEGLLNWTKPFKTEYAFSANVFSIFLPPSKKIMPGTTWWIVESDVDNYVGLKSSVKHFPPEVESKFQPLVSLLSLFHPRPFLWTRFGPQGTCATLRAVSANYYDIIFRMHAEFQLNEPPFHPFWFTPSQFHGRLIINKDASIVQYFEMEVPDKKLNVDMEWLNGPNEDSMEVDIGYVPHMSLTATAISAPFRSDLGADEDISSIKWDYETTEEEAFGHLEESFFKFKKVKYYNLSDAFKVAEREFKLVHGIVLWGNLDDQSC